MFYVEHDDDDYGEDGMAMMMMTMVVMMMMMMMTMKTFDDSCSSYAFVFMPVYILLQCEWIALSVS